MKPQFRSRTPAIVRVFIGMAALIFGLIGQPFEAHAANLRRVSQVLGTTIAGPGRVQLLYFPTQPAKVAGDVYRWLRQGRLEQVFRPTDANMITMDSVGRPNSFSSMPTTCKPSSIQNTTWYHGAYTGSASTNSITSTIPSPSRQVHRCTP